MFCSTVCLCRRVMGGRYDEASGDRRAHLGSKVQNAATDIAKSYVVAEAQMQARRKAFEAQVCALC